MTVHRLLWSAITLAGLLATASPSLADDYPSRAIKIVVPNPPGGSNDLLARVLADKLKAKWGKPVVVDNRAGAAGNIGAQLVFAAPPDGYTLLVTTPAPLVTNKFLYAKLAYDPDSFVPVTEIAESPNLLVVIPSVPATSVAELIAYAKANPDALNYASQGAGTGAHLTTELLKLTTGIQIVHIPYKGTAPAMVDMLAGRVEMMFIAFGDALADVRAGKLRALAVGTETRNPLLPDVPTMAETLPGFRSTFWQGMVAPPGTPPDIASKIAAAVADIIRQPDVEKILGDNEYRGVGDTPAEMAAFMSQESKRWGTVIRTIGATAD